jgi:hypothetical protein
MCKVDIGFEAEYFTCSVSTCNRKRVGLFFCSVACFEAHLPEARHRDAWAEPQRSPSEAAALAEADEADDDEPAAAPAQRRVVSAAGAAKPAEAAPGEASEADVLIVVSKLKKYVKDRSGMNTSDAVVAVLSIRQAGQDGRRTVLDRDFTKVLEQLGGASREGNFRSRR